ncbi:hypothetical protein MYX64_06535 [Nitrospinae bacterium AH_259_B05_G02_I21]|nr:hypothetical protein [Nitrospinae bacterium AH_259_B05_G02_I21]
MTRAESASGGRRDPPADPRFKVCPFECGHEPWAPGHYLFTNSAFPLADGSVLTLVRMTCSHSIVKEEPESFERFSFYITENLLGPALPPGIDHDALMTKAFILRHTQVVN